MARFQVVQHTETSTKTLAEYDSYISCRNWLVETFADRTQDPMFPQTFYVSPEKIMISIIDTEAEDGFIEEAY